MARQLEEEAEEQRRVQQVLAARRRARRRQPPRWWHGAWRWAHGGGRVVMGARKAGHAAEAVVCERAVAAAQQALAEKIEAEETARLGQEEQYGSLQEEITLGDPGDATRPIDVSEIEELRKLKAYRAETKRRTPLVEPEKTNSALHDDSPTAPVFDSEATEYRSVPSRETEKPNHGAAALAALVSPRHIGRKDEIEVLLSTLKTVRKAGAHGVLIEGEEGVGKTRLLHTFRGLAWVKGARVAIGACEEGGDVLCGPFQEVLLRLAGPGLARSHREALLGPDKATLYRFFPKLVHGFRTIVYS